MISYHIQFQGAKISDASVPFTSQVYMSVMLLLLTTNLRSTGCFIMFSVITNISNKKTKGPTLMELFTTTEKQKKVFFDN